VVFKLDPVSIIFALSLFNNSLATLAKYLGGTAINIYRNYDGFCIRSALIQSAHEIQCDTFNYYPTHSIVVKWTLIAGMSFSFFIIVLILSRFLARLN